MILLYGYYGEKNAGDDAFTTVCTNELAARGHRKIGVLASELPNVPTLPARRLLFQRRYRGLASMVERARVSNWLERGAQIVIGGGSLFRSSASLIELDQLLDRSPRRGHHAIGVSIGPFRDESASEHCRRVLLRLDSVSVRDEVSLQRAQALAPEANVRLTFDLAPLLARWLEPARPAPPSISEQMGVGLCGPALSAEGYRAIRTAVGAWLRGRQDRTAVLLPFNSHPRKGDVATHQRLAEDLRSDGKVEVYRYDGDPRRMWSKIGQLDGVIAMRLHAAVFAFCTDRPTLIVPYEEKCLAWAAMVGHRPDLIIEAPDVNLASLDLLRGVSSTAPGLSVPEATKRASTNFDWANHESD